jgi:HlyD family secretion protein
MASRRKFVFILAGVSFIVIVPLIAFLGTSRFGSNGTSREVRVERGAIDAHFAARGRVEGATSQEIKLAARTFGRLLEVSVNDGDPVHKGQVVAVLENRDAKGRVEEARAGLARSQAALEKLLNGARPEERSAAKAEMDEAQAAAQNARQQFERVQKLFHEGGIVSQAALDQAERDLKVTQARLESLKQRYQLIMAPPRTEDVAAARADVELARARVTQAEDYYDNTFIRSPVEGVVVKRFMNPGESISYESLYQPVITVTDTTHMTVRAEIDETDIGKIQVGQRAEIHCDAFPGRTFAGRVVRISGGLGKKNIRTDNPLEKVDTDVLESFVEVKPGSPLRVGLRVDLYFPLERKENVLVIPRRAVEMRDGVAKVRVKFAAGVSQVPVRVGIQDGLNIEIAEGLKEGDVVVY